MIPSRRVSTAELNDVFGQSISAASLPESTAIQPSVHIASPETLTQEHQDELFLHDVLGRMRELAQRDDWSDKSKQALENQIDTVLWRETGSDETRQQRSISARLWQGVQGINSKSLRWEFVAALRRLRSPEAVALENSIVSMLLSSESPGDRIAAIRSLWKRDRRRARPILNRIAKSEADPIVSALLAKYLQSATHGTSISKAA